MTDHQRNEGTQDAAPADDARSSVPARRRFLARGSAVGTGVVVMTVHHRRGFAQTAPLVVSSAATCNSLGRGVAAEGVPYPEGHSLYNTGATGVQCTDGTVRLGDQQIQPSGQPEVKKA